MACHNIPGEDDVTPSRAPSETRALRSFAVSTKDYPDHEKIVIAHSAGAAKYRYWIDIRDAYPEYPFTSMRARAVGGYVEPDGFRRCVEYRQIQFAKVMMLVRLDDGREGRIIGHNSSANLDVIFDGGVVMNCHPACHISYFVDGMWIRSPQAGER
jgi:hypothetical protein